MVIRMLKLKIEISKRTSRNRYSVTITSDKRKSGQTGLDHEELIHLIASRILDLAIASGEDVYA